MIEKGVACDLLEEYLATTMDLKKESALVRVGDEWQTLDGTPHVSLRKLARTTDHSLTDLQADFDTGKLPGVRIGNQRYARQEG